MLQTKISEATKMIHDVLQDSVHTDPERKAKWRVNPKYFVIPEGEPEFAAGSVDFAHSWFESQREVSSIYFQCSCSV
jgi:hypothetical protein